MKRVVKSLSFPMAGVSRIGNYRSQTRPYATPWAENVRGICSLESRHRGGSRPGLAKTCNSSLANIKAMLPVVSVNNGVRNYRVVAIADGSIYLFDGESIAVSSEKLTTENGTPITTDDGRFITFPSTISAGSPVGATNADCGAVRNGKVYLADSKLKCFNPEDSSIEDVTNAPENQPIVCSYRDRLFLAGENLTWFCSRQSDVNDWDFGADFEDTGRAVAGIVSEAGKIGDKVTALIPIKDRALVFACKNSLWVLYGDPTSGKVENISNEYGIISKDAWAVSADGLMTFLTNEGVYIWQAGSQSAPARFSESKMPDKLRNVSIERNIISMAYDPSEKGFHLFVTPQEGKGMHYWLDSENKAIWPVTFGNNGLQPVTAMRTEGSGLSEVLFGCKDGFIRKFDEESLNDDGEEIASRVLIGPIAVGSDFRDAMLTEIHGVMADLPHDCRVIWRIFSDDSAEGVADKATVGAGVKAGGAWKNGRNKTARPRVRGSWLTIEIASLNKWAFESVTIISKQLGKLK